MLTALIIWTVYTYFRDPEEGKEMLKALRKKIRG